MPKILKSGVPDGFMFGGPWKLQIKSGFGAYFKISSRVFSNFFRQQKDPHATELEKVQVIHVSNGHSELRETQSKAPWLPERFKHMLLLLVRPTKPRIEI